MGGCPVQLNWPFPLPYLPIYSQKVEISIEYLDPVFYILLLIKSIVIANSMNTIGKVEQPGSYFVFNSVKYVHIHGVCPIRYFIPLV